MKIIRGQLSSLSCLLRFVSQSRSAGVIKKSEPMFYTIHYVIDEDSIPLLIDIEEIGVDEYLDNINDNKYFKQDETKRSKQDSEDS